MSFIHPDTIVDSYVALYAALGCLWVVCAGFAILRKLRR